MGELPLDTYLARNSRPKVLILAINPGNVSVDQNRLEDQTVDAWWLMLEHSSWETSALNFFKSSSHATRALE